MREGRYSSRRLPVVSRWPGILTIIACLGCWIMGYAFSIGYPVYGEVSSTPLWNIICMALPGKAFTYFIGFILMALGALLLHRANLELRFIREKTLLPFILYILFISTNPDFLPLNATSLGTYCLILAMYELFSSYHSPEKVSKAFNTALLIGIGSLLWIHIIWFLPLFWYGMYTFRTFSLRGVIASLLGIGIIYWLLFGWNILFYNYQSFIIPFASLFKINLQGIGEWDLWQTITTLWIAGLTVVASFNIITHEFDDNLRTREYLFFLMFFAIWAFTLFFLYEQTSDELLEIACIPCSILLAHFFTVQKGKIVFWLFLLTPLLFLARFINYIWNFL
ncbi:DUF6427 family protein [Parabacteroides sp. Marseille-P3160]|uniref:DUF6427 family protein n=1 Tax=Parabacteroides sp. Marseille-P3160 TaxID=1917887 RepID=UPI0009BBBB72|nr:DUF6427 family protein [Parabacteroides sp. Marseille-P3160]